MEKMTKKYIAHLGCKKAKLAMIVIFLVCSLLAFIMYLHDSEEERRGFFFMFVVFAILCGVGILILAILLLEFVSFSDDKIVITDRRLFGIPIVKEYKISSFEKVSFVYDRGPSIEIYKKNKYFPKIVLELRDDIVEEILKYFPQEMLYVWIWNYKFITKKQIELLYPYMDKKTQKKLMEKGYKQEDE